MIGIVIPNMPKDEEICTKAMGQKALGNVSINCEEQGRDYYRFGVSSFI